MKFSLYTGVIDLNGRFFGGRTVKACFYNLDKFRRLDLADEIEWRLLKLLWITLIVLNGIYWHGY